MLKVSISGLDFRSNGSIVQLCVKSMEVKRGSYTEIFNAVNGDTLGVKTLQALYSHFGGVPIEFNITILGIERALPPQYKGYAQEIATMYYQVLNATLSGNKAVNVAARFEPVKRSKVGLDNNIVTIYLPSTYASGKSHSISR